MKELFQIRFQTQSQGAPRAQKKTGRFPWQNQEKSTEIERKYIGSGEYCEI